MTGRARTAVRALALITWLACAASPALAQEDPGGPLRAWLDAALATDPFDLATGGERPDATAALRRTERELDPTWSLDPSARVGYDGAWRATARGRVDVPLYEPNVERRLREARHGLARARLNDRLARRDAAESLLSTALQWWQARHAASLLDAARARAEALPPPPPDAAEELRAWERMREEVALERALMRAHLQRRVELDPATSPPPDPLRGPAARALRAPVPREGLEACLARAPNVLRARRALEAARAEREGRAQERNRLHLGLSGALDVRGTPANPAPTVSGSARVRLEVGWPPHAATTGSVGVSAGVDAVRVDARMASPRAPRPERDALRNARRRLEEARFDASVSLRRVELEFRQLRRARSVPGDPTATLRSAPDVPSLLERLDTTLGDLQRRARAATLAVRLAVACDPAVSSGSWSTSRTPRTPTTPSTR